MADNLLTIRGLTVSANGVQKILNSVDLTIAKGEVLGLIGESGAGKSTLGMAAMGYVKPGCHIKAGSIMFDGQELVGASEAELSRLRGARIAYVAQSAAVALNPFYRIQDQYCEAPVQHGTASKGEALEDARAMYARMQLPDPKHIGERYPHQVSGGQLQRMMTAMAKACRPDLIIFDEPTTALDVTTQIEVLAAIKDLVKTYNTAAIYITHDLAVVAQMADRIKVLRYGQEVEEAPARKMLADPQEVYTQSLWAVRGFRKQGKVQEDAHATPVLQVFDLDAYYGAVPVLHKLNFELRAGETLAVVGESGSGKSTTARCITGLLPPANGKIQFKGDPLPAELGKRDKATLQRIQMVHQMADTALNPQHRIRQILGRPLAFFLGLKGDAKEARIRELLELIELPADTFIDRYPGALSGGQKQRLCIARALAAEPEVIICDEVTSALDQLVAEGILKLLDKLQRELNLAYLFITHDLATVRSVADRVLVMQHGRIIEQGEKEAIFSPPYEPYTELLLSSLPEMDPDWLSGLLAKRQQQTPSTNT